MTRRHRSCAGLALAVSFLTLGWIGAACAQPPPQPPSTTAAPSAADNDPYLFPRRAMIRAIEADVRATSRSTGRDQLDPRVMEVMARVPRHEFVPPSLRGQAYENHPLPIGEGQTISQPYIVALMTDLLDPEPDHVVLEVGTGSGYQAAILAELVGKVYTIEIIETLGRQAGERLKQLGYTNVEIRIGDGYHGWEEHAPFDGIIVTAAAPAVPPPLVEQLKPGGVMVIPVGGGFMAEELTVIRKSEDGRIERREVLPVRFVPLTGDH